MHSARRDPKSLKCLKIGPNEEFIKSILGQKTHPIFLDALWLDFERRAV